VLAEGYKEYHTDRKYMAKMGNWRENKDSEIPLDGIGGVNILVKGDVHRSGEFCFISFNRSSSHSLPIIYHLSDEEKMRVLITNQKQQQASTSPATPLKIKPRRKGSRKWQRERDTASTVCRITSFGTLIPTRSLVMLRSLFCFSFIFVFVLRGLCLEKG